MSTLTKFASSLLGQSRGPDPEVCEMLGNKAAQMALDANIDLSDAVVKVSSARPDLNNTHINNICWVANNEYFRKVAKARQEAGENLVFDYALADPPDVAKRINASASPKVAYVRGADYDMPPQQVLPPEEALKEAMSYEEAPEEPVSHENPLYELGALRESLFTVRDQAAEKVASVGGLVDALEDKLYHQVKQAALSNIPLGHITALLMAHPDGQTGVEKELPKVASRLALEEPIVFHSFKKTANYQPEGFPDTSHPIYDTYGGLRDLRKDLFKMKIAHRIARDEAEYAWQAEQQGIRKMAARPFEKSSALGHVLGGAALGGLGAAATGNKEHMLPAMVGGAALGVGVRSSKAVKGQIPLGKGMAYSWKTPAALGVGGATAYTVNERLKRQVPYDMAVADQYANNMMNVGPATGGRWG